MTDARVTIAPPAPPWPAPVAKLLGKAAQATSAAEQHKLTYCAFEVSVLLATLALPATATSKLTTPRPSAGDWVRILFRRRHERKPTRQTRVTRASDLADTIDFFDTAKQWKQDVALEALFGAVVAHRNDKISHAGYIEAPFLLEATRHMLRLVEFGWTNGWFLVPGAHLELHPHAPPDVLAPHVHEGDSFDRSLAPWVLVCGDSWLFFRKMQGKCPSYIDYLTGKPPPTAFTKLLPDLQRALKAEFIDRDPATLAGIHRYALTSPLGQGGMGTLHLAYDWRDDRDVVCKRVTPLGERPKLERRLSREAELLKKLGNLGIHGVVEYIDRFVESPPTDERSSGDADASKATTNRAPNTLVMEFVPGCNLRDLARMLDRGDDITQIQDLFPILPDAAQIDAPREASGPTPWPHTSVEAYLRLIKDALVVLDEVHRQGVLHNDLTPLNIMVRAEKNGLAPVLVDFGISVERDASTQLTGARGTEGYADPHVKGNDYSAQSDLYAMGMLIHRELLSHPMRSATLTEPTRHRLNTLYHACTASNVAQRPRSAADVARQLEHIVTHLDDTRFALTEERLGANRRMTRVVGPLLLGLVPIGYYVSTKVAPTSSPPSSDPSSLTSPPSPSSLTSPSAPPSAPPLVTASVDAPPPLSANCRRWLDAASEGRFEGDFGPSMKGLAERIGTRKLVKLDFDVPPDNLPCAGSNDAWETYVVAVMRADAAWNGARELQLSPPLREALAEKHRRGKWPDKPREELIRTYTLGIIQAAQKSREPRQEGAARRACAFAASVGAAPNTCVNYPSR